MKKTLLILSILLFSCSTEDKLQKIIDDHTNVDNNVKGPLEENINVSGLKGKVKSVSFSNYSAIAKFGEIKKSEFIWRYESKFNVDGNMEYKIDLNKEDIVLEHKEINYDENGNPIKYTEAIINDYEISPPYSTQKIKIDKRLLIYPKNLKK
jgi:hypothetical protein